MKYLRIFSNLPTRAERAKRAMRLFAVICCLALFGCGEPSPKAQETIERRSPANYRCDKDQLETVIKEMSLCNKSFFQDNDTCYRIAKRANCEYIGYQAQDGR